MTIIEDEVDIPVVEELADSIRRISVAAHAMLNSGLNRRALVLLIQDASKVNKKDIEAVLRVLPGLERMYLQEED